MKKSSTHPIPDKAEVSIDFPDKFYIGSFPRDAKFEARAEDDGLFIKLTRIGENRRQVEIHLHHQLLADILSEWAVSLVFFFNDTATTEKVYSLPWLRLRTPFTNYL